MSRYNRKFTFLTGFALGTPPMSTIFDTISLQFSNLYAGLSFFSRCPFWRPEPVIRNRNKREFSNEMANEEKWKKFGRD